jgi:hypothetical protein
LADFDHEAIEQHNITARDIENVLRYVALLRGPDSRTYADEVPVEKPLAAARAIRETKGDDE